LSKQAQSDGVIDVMYNPFFIKNSPHIKNDFIDMGNVILNLIAEEDDIVGTSYWEKDNNFILLIENKISCVIDSIDNCMVASVSLYNLLSPLEVANIIEKLYSIKNLCTVVMDVFTEEDQKLWGTDATSSI